MPPIRVCFVCLGNICRSPTAEAVFLNLLAEQGVADSFVVDSAGTSAHHVGQRAHPETPAAARARGFEVPSISRQFAASDFDEFDYVVAMDRQNRQDLLRLGGGRPVHLFRDFDPDCEPGEDVPDPYYCGGFPAVISICEGAARGLLAHLRHKHSI